MCHNSQDLSHEWKVWRGVKEECEEKSMLNHLLGFLVKKKKQKLHCLSLFRPLSPYCTNNKSISFLFLFFFFFTTTATKATTFRIQFHSFVCLNRFFPLVFFHSLFLWTNHHHEWTKKKRGEVVYMQEEGKECIKSSQIFLRMSIMTIKV